MDSKRCLETFLVGRRNLMFDRIELHNARIVYTSSKCYASHSIYRIIICKPGHFRATTFNSY